MTLAGLALALALTGACGGDTPSGDADTGEPPLTGLGLTVLPTAARACELVLDDPDGVIADVRFDDSVQGRFVRRAPRIAVSFLRAADAPIDAGAVTLQAAGDDANVSVRVAHCYGSDGARLGDATPVEVNR